VQNVRYSLYGFAYTKGKEVYIGLRDFSGMLIDWFQNEGFIYHSK
jgi:hypothetical protein